MSKDGMSVLMIGGDKNVLTPGTEAFVRMELQKKSVDTLDVFVWPQVHSKRQIWRAARTKKYDVITTQDPFWRGLLAWKIARFAGMKLNVQVHADLAGQSVFRRVLARFVLRRADSVRVVSDRVKEQVVSARVRVPIHTLPVFIDLTRFRGMEHRPHEGKHIVWAGRFEPEKDPLAAIDCFERVLHSIPDARLTMVGEGSLRSAIMSRAKQLPVALSDGWEDFVPFLETADLFIVTSLHESWGAVIVEALAAGVPVLSMDVGIAREAGAIVASREEFPSKAVDLLRSGARGSLRIVVPDADEWRKRWKTSLV